MKTLSPVLLIVYNRPDKTKRVLEAIRNVEPAKLFIVADGPKVGSHGDEALVAETRAVFDSIDWECQVSNLYRSENLGLKRSVGEGISWFFDHVEEGIILEDDCIPHEDFFTYCDELLTMYRDKQEVSAITGNNFQEGRWRGNGSYYFSCYPHIWGWATWKRAWQHYDPSITFWPDLRESEKVRSLLISRQAYDFWLRLLDNVYEGKIESTWDYSWTASVWDLGGLTATPNVNLVSNIGFDSSATHTKNESSQLSELVTYALGDITHPESVKQDLDADRYAFRRVFQPRLSLPYWLVATIYGFFERMQTKKLTANEVPKSG
jgi:hypothetical protein